MTSLGNKSIIKNILNNINQMLEIEKSVSNIIGNAGGYLGLFLGYALLNVPNLIQDAYDWAKNRFKNEEVRASTIVESDVETGS